MNVVAVVISRNVHVGTIPRLAQRRRMYIQGETSGETLSIYMPYAPKEIAFGSLAQDWTTTERSGDKPLLLRKGDMLATMKFSATLANVDRFRPQTELINALRRLAKTRERVVVRYGPTEAGLWRITDMDISSVERHPDTNEITQAVVNLGFTEASDAAPAVGPVAPPPPPPPPPKPPTPRVHVVVKGECLWRIAQRYYGQGALWPRIYDANRSQIRIPDLIYPGQRFIIP